MERSPNILLLEHGHVLLPLIELFLHVANDHLGETLRFSSGPGQQKGRAGKTLETEEQVTFRFGSKI